MLYHNKIDISDGIDVNRTSLSKKCIICHYWYFLKIRFRFEPTICRGCHDLLMMSIDINSIAVPKIYGTDCCCTINEIK